MTVGRIFTKIDILISLSWAFFENRKKLGSHTRSKWWPGDPDVKDDPNDPLTRWPNDPVLCLISTASTAWFLAPIWVHTHTFNGPFSGTTRVDRYEKDKTNLDFTEARDSEWQRHQLGHMQVCTSLQTDNHASTPPLGFLQAGCPSCRPTNSVKALKAMRLHESSSQTGSLAVQPFLHQSSICPTQ